VAQALLSSHGRKEAALLLYVDEGIGFTHQPYREVADFNL
jgi:hypothetical protein